MEIYSNCTASYAIENGRIVEKIEFADPIASNLLLEKEQQTPEEEKLLKKHPKATVLKTRNAAIVSLVSHDLQAMREISFRVAKRKIKDSVKNDTLIIQVISHIDELDKSINLLSKRLREWYELYNPEFSRAVESHERFVNTILIKSKDESLKELNIKETMGADLPKHDLEAIMHLAKQIKALFELRKTQEEYLETLMKKECPNITEVAGVAIGAKLISLARSLERLSKFPASTVQLLGAEKALFRHLRNRNNRPPKFGILHEHPLVVQVAGKNKGKMARAIADKLSIAAKVDFFKGAYVGKQLAADVQKKAEELK